MRGIRSKRRTTRNGRIVGGLPFSRGALFHLLRNRTFLGQIVHKDTVYPGRHEPIVDAALFEAVQARLDANIRGGGETRDPGTRVPSSGAYSMATRRR